MSENLFSIGGLAQRVGVPVPTLRTWERRYGFPRCVRLPSGHRRYTEAEASRVKLLVRAIETGARPAAIAEFEPDALAALLTPVAGAAVDRVPSAAERWLSAASSLDARRFDQELRRSELRVGSVALALELVPPFLVRVGDAWASGEITVGVEHFISERLISFLGELWRDVPPDEGAPTVVLATLPGELHGLALHLCAVLAASRGVRVVFVGRDTPLSSIADAAERSGARAIALSLASSSDSARAREALTELRGLTDAAIWIGGSGSVGLGPLPGVERPAGLAALTEWFDRLSR